MEYTTDYSPPTSAQTKNRQNDTDALRLLIAQRRLYAKAKRWLSLRWFGMLVLGVAAPVVAVVWPSMSVTVGAIAGIWLYLGRTWLFSAQSRLTGRAASVQHELDSFIFGMPSGTIRSTMPSLEQISLLTGPDDKIREVAEKEELIDWYPINEANSGMDSVAIAQRANASYADSLLETTATVWTVASISWGIVLIALSATIVSSPTAILLGIVLPVLPASLDVSQYLIGLRGSVKERRDLAQEIESHLTGAMAPVTPGHLLAWQERLFHLRNAAPQVPDLLYRIKRKLNERAMHEAADRIGRQTRKGT